MKQAEIYEAITEKLIKMIEAGEIPWRKPWRTEAPRNLVSKKEYRGINTWILGWAPYDSPYWLTYKQARTLGGHVNTGEKGTLVIFWKWIEKEDPETGEKDGVPLLRHYTVFNTDQCTLPEGKVPKREEKKHKPIEEAEQIERWYLLEGKGPLLENGGDRACYSPREDKVQMPMVGRFDKAEEYYSTLFHELVHSTGHPSRLNRFKKEEALAPFGSPDYSKEELVAEFGAAFLCGTVGIENVTVENSAAYLQHWLKALQKDTKLAIQAAARAQKAVDLILGKVQVEEEAEAEKKELVVA